jgi:hypothetical protein
MFTTATIAAMSRFPFGEEGRFAALIDFTPYERIHRQLEAGRHVLIDILRFIIAEGEHSYNFGVPETASP